ncbi:hypothetical protein CLV40_12268 [Actinokineospora auranticolor]|uniref:Uncharacterized protein n=1 Tax=Actinokineospora auranticolor TaxID=155976 RepID=A0A2S6GFT3_9PSEU|nr:hypothetical protein CLV40_12268 [Actinokineospora auranticolor]
MNPARRWSGLGGEVGIDLPSGDLFSRGLNATSSVARWGETSLCGAPTNLRWGKAVGGASQPTRRGSLAGPSPHTKTFHPIEQTAGARRVRWWVGLAHVGGQRVRPGGAVTGCEAVWPGWASAARAGGGRASTRRWVAGSGWRSDLGGEGVCGSRGWRPGWHGSIGSGFGLAGRQRGCEMAWAGRACAAWAGGTGLAHVGGQRVRPGGAGTVARWPGWGGRVRLGWGWVTFCFDHPEGPKHSPRPPLGGQPCSSLSAPGRRGRGREILWIVAADGDNSRSRKFAAGWVGGRWGGGFGLGV